MSQHICTPFEGKPSKKIARNGMRRKVVGGEEQGSLPGCARQFPPSDKFDVLLLKQLAKFLAGEEVEIALAPGSAPRVTLASSGFHFVIGEGQMNDEFGDAGLKIFQSDFIEFSPLFRGNGRGDGDGVVENDVARSQTGFQRSRNSC